MLFIFAITTSVKLDKITFLKKMSVLLSIDIKRNYYSFMRHWLPVQYFECQYLFESATNRCTLIVEFSRSMATDLLDFIASKFLVMETNLLWEMKVWNWKSIQRSICVLLLKHKFHLNWIKSNGYKYLSLQSVIFLRIFLQKVTDNFFFID